MKSAPVYVTISQGQPGLGFGASLSVHAAPREA